MMNIATPARKNDWFGPFARHIALPFSTRRNHPAFARYLNEFEASQYLSRTAIEELQVRRLRKLLLHAFDNCPFYTVRVKKTGWTRRDLESLSPDQLTAFPLLSKRDIQDFREELTARNIPSELRVRNQTGGSTGSPLQFWVDRKRFDSRRASTVRHNRWVGMNPGDWLAVLWGARLDQEVRPGWRGWLRNQLITRCVELNTSTIRESDWQKFINEIRAKRPRFLLAYAQSAVLFAEYLNHRKIADINFQSVITTAEVLLPEQRGLLEECFHCRVFNRYGCREVSVIASECEQHTGMHVNADALLVEIVPAPDIPAPAGKVVITDLFNLSMPLIRYEVGDVATWAPEQQCPCGRGLPLLADVQGRISDFLTLSDGRQISGPSLTLVVADLSEVRQVQFVQEAPDSITLRVVPGTDYDGDTESELRRRLSLYLGNAAILHIEKVDAIRSELSGKYRFVINAEKSAAGRTTVS